mgnify:CR=1 FL=1
MTTTATESSCRVRVATEAFQDIAERGLMGSPSRSPMPTLICAAIEISGARLSISGTNASLWTKAWTEQTDNLGGQDFRCLVSAARLKQIVGHITGPTCVIELLDETLRIADDAGEWNVPVSSGEHPPTPEGEYEEFVKATANSIAASLRVGSAMSSETTRFAIHGLSLEHTGTTARFTSTDDRRIHFRDLAKMKSKARHWIIAAEAVSVMKSVLKGDDEISIEVSNQAVRLTIGDFSMASLLVEGSFPPYDGIVKDARNSENMLTADRVAMLAAIDRVSMMGDVGRGVRLGIAKDKLTIRACDPEFGEGKTTINATATQSLDYGINSRFLKDAVAMSDSVEVPIKFSKATAPLYIDCGSGFVAVVQGCALHG